MAFIIPLLIWLPLVLLAPYFLTLSLKNKQRRLHKSPKKNPPPGPPKLPILGNLHQIGRTPNHESLWHLSKQYGPVMLLHLGKVPTLVISSAEAAKEILKTNDLHCCSRPTYTGSRRLTYNYLDVAFSPYTDYWKEIRKICVMELFSVKRVQANRFIREDEAAKMVDSISPSCGAPVDLSAHLFAFVASILFRVGFGTSLQGTEYKNGRDVLGLLNTIDAMIGSRTWGEFFPSWIGGIIDKINGVPQKFDKIFAELDGFFQQLVDEHLKRGRKQENEDIIDVLLKAASDQTSAIGAQPAHDAIKAVLLNLVLGGIDATAVSVTSVMAMMSRNPSMMKKAQQEVRKYVGDKGKVTESDLEELHYMKLLIKETLRLHPPVPLMLAHEIMSEIKIQGYDIAPKTQYYVNTWAVARDPEFWKDPEEFIPERFDGSSIDYKGQHFGFLPFGSGRRICPGIYMGATTVELALANLLYSFDWRLPVGEEEDLNINKRLNLSLVPLKFLQKNIG